MCQRKQRFKWYYLKHFKNCLLKIEGMEPIKPTNGLGSLKPAYIGQEKFHTLLAHILKFTKLTAL